MIEVYTDGSVDNNAIRINSGGCAFAAIRNEIVLLEGFYPYENTTNNRMEIMAAIHAIEEISREFPRDEILIYSDSQYLVNSVNNKWIYSWQKKNWKRGEKVVPNNDLWIWLISILNEKIKFKWTRGHVGTEWNEYVDTLSRSYML